MTTLSSFQMQQTLTRAFRRSRSALLNAITSDLSFRFLGSCSDSPSAVRLPSFPRFLFAQPTSLCFEGGGVLVCALCTVLRIKAL